MLRNAKVRYLADSLQIDEDIVSFEISVQDVSRMQISESVDNLTRAMSSQVVVETTLQFAQTFAD